MEQADISSTKSKTLELLNGAIFTLILTALVVVLSFAYNAGYNSYYGLPIFLTNTSVLGLLEKTLILSDVFVILIFSLLIGVFIYRLLKHLIKCAIEKSAASSKSMTNVALFIVIPTLFVAFLVILILDKSITLVITLSAFFVLWLFALVINLRLTKLKTRLSQAKKTSKEVVSGSKNEDVLNQEVDNISKETLRLQEFSETMPTTKIWILPSLLIIFATIVAITFKFGHTSAYNQETYYFSDQSHIVVGAYYEKAILVCVNKDFENDTYFVTGRYSFSNFEDITITTKNCGKILSPYYKTNKLETIDTLG